MNAPTKQTQSIEDKITSIRERLEDIFTQLYTILDVCITCHKALDVQNVQQDDSVARFCSAAVPTSCTSSSRS